MNYSKSLLQILSLLIVFGASFIQSNAIDFENTLLHEEEIVPAVEKLDCIEFRSLDGVYASAGLGEPSATACGLYLVGDVTSRIKVEFLEFNVDCAFGNVVGVLDGWEQSGNIFPPAKDLLPGALRNRHSSYCGSKRPLKTFYSSGNFALIQYKLHKLNQFVIRVTFEENPKPCNTVALGNEGHFELHNYKQRVNCSVMIIHPQQIQIVFMNVGKKRLSHGLRRALGLGSGLKKISKSCNPDSRQADYVEILGGKNWSVRDMHSFGPLCGLAEMTDPKEVFCETTVVRLVSSGHYDNLVVVEHTVAKKESGGGDDVGMCPIA